MNIPKILPDEHIFGWCGRIKIFNAHPSMNITIKEIRKNFTVPITQFESGSKAPNAVLSMACASGLATEEFLRKHSFLFFINLFGVTGYNSHEGDWSNVNTFIHVGRTGKIGAWYCISCLLEDSENKQLPYWRRHHQLIGVNWCFKHRHKLKGILQEGMMENCPPTKISHANNIELEGPEHLDEAPELIRRYVEISYYLLNIEFTLDRSKLINLLARQLLMLEGFDIDGLIESNERTYWESWIDQLKKLRKNRHLMKLLDFKTLLTADYQFETERYVLAAAVLFNSLNSFIDKIEHQCKRLDDTDRGIEMRKSAVWQLDDVTEDYFKAMGSHRVFSELNGIDLKKISKHLTDFGLPDLNDENQKIIPAVKEFYAGSNIFELSKKYDISQSEIESLLRIYGRRLNISF